jgi:phage-related tail protein
MISAKPVEFSKCHYDDRGTDDDSYNKDIKIRPKKLLERDIQRIYTQLEQFKNDFKRIRENRNKKIVAQPKSPVILWSLDFKARPLNR